MKKNELLLDVIGEAREEYLAELDRRTDRVRSRRRWLRGSLIAASVILVVSIVMQFAVVFFQEGGARGAYFPRGIAAGGYFYYEAPGEGFFRSEPEKETVQLVKGNLFDRWFNRWYSFTANDYGFYYTKGNWVYRIKHGETQSEKLYRYDGKTTLPYMYPAGANDIAIEANYEGAGDVGLRNELFILDGVTGEVKTMIVSDNTITQPQTDEIRRILRTKEPGDPEYDEAFDRLTQRQIDFAQSVTYTVGDRTLELVLEEGNDWFDYAYRLTENGKWLGEYYVEPYDVRTAGDSLIFGIGRDGLGVSDEYRRLLVVRSDGSLYELHASTQGNRDYCFSYEQWYGGEDSYYEKDVHIIRAVRITDDGKIELSWDAPDEWIGDLDSDGKYIWLNYFERIACYRIEYRDGEPAALTLIDENIMLNDR